MRADDRQEWALAAIFALGGAGVFIGGHVGVALIVLAWILGAAALAYIALRGR